MTWSWAVATCRGTSHIRENTECQDTSRCIVAGENDEVLIAIVSDGAGSAPYGKEGSVLTCRTVSESARRHFAKSSQSPTDEEVWEWVDSVRDRISRGADLRKSKPRDFAATLVGAICTPNETLIMHIGDGAMVCNFDGQWQVPSWPAHGEYASTTFFVTDDPAADLKIARLPYQPEAIGVFSDGIERLVLRFADKTASASFFDKFINVVRRADQRGHNHQLSASLKGYLSSAQITERTDDDKSLILAVRL